MTIDAVVEAAARRTRLVTAIVLVVIAVTSWIYVLAGAGMGMTAWEMTRMGDGVVDHAVSELTSPPRASPPVAPMVASMTAPATWSLGYAVIMFSMWWVMMVAMMLPSASPMILLFATVNRKQRAQGNPYAPTALFAFGYLAVWAMFSMLAAGAQWGLSQSDRFSDAMVVTSKPLCAGILIAAGLYQFTRLKQTCLIHCRSPLHFLSHRWRSGFDGALLMGIEHGAYCAGCCWFLMLLLFAGGVMNLFWICGLALYVLLEKVVSRPTWISQATGGLLIAGGLVLLT
jgi:predicted metal-binding membrane protein